MKELLDGFSIEQLKNFSDFGTAGTIEVSILAQIVLAVKQAKPALVIPQAVTPEDVRWMLSQSDHDNGYDCRIEHAENIGAKMWNVCRDEMSANADSASQRNIRDAIEGIGHIRRTLEETFGGLHGTHVEPDVLVESKEICDAIYAAYRNAAPQAQIIDGDHQAAKAALLDLALSGKVSVNMEPDEAKTFSMPPLNDDLIFILGKPNFTCNIIAECLRIGGEEIRRKSENEQAAVIYWMLNLYLAHGPEWKDEANKELARIKASCTKQEDK